MRPHALFFFEGIIESKSGKICDKFKKKKKIKGQFELKIVKEKTLFRAIDFKNKG
jgi:hypothetical protein